MAPLHPLGNWRRIVRIGRISARAHHERISMRRAFATISL
jgi:hypothetical protein